MAAKLPSLLSKHVALAPYLRPFCNSSSIANKTGRRKKSQQLITLVSWNINAFSNRHIARASAILNHILTRPSTPDVIFLQEVTKEARARMLGEKRVREAYFDVEDKRNSTHFENVPFATMTLLSKRRFIRTPSDDDEPGWISEGQQLLNVESVVRHKLPSHYGRDALCTDISFPRKAQAPGQHGLGLRLINVHLDSLAFTLQYRVEQMAILAGLLRDSGRGLIAGDFNAISDEDEELATKNGLTDAWTALRIRSDSNSVETGITWGVYENGGRGPKRLDRVATLGVESEGMEIYHPQFIPIPLPGGADKMIRWSDHSGLMYTFKVGFL